MDESNGVAIARNPAGRNVALVPNVAAKEIPEAKKLYDIILADGNAVAAIAGELRPDLIESRVKGRTVAITTVVSGIRQARGAGLAYQDKTDSERATLTAPVSIAAAPTLQNHYLNLPSLAARLEFIQSLTDFEVSAIAQLPRAVVGLTPDEFDRLVAQRLMRHHIAVELMRINPESIYRNATLANLFPAKSVSPEKLDIFVELKNRELAQRDDTMVGLQTILNSAISYLQVIYDLNPTETLDRVLGRTA